jgi:hypothetical protein
VTDTEYDEQTLQQFAAKKQSYLAAEQAKAQRREEHKQRLMIVEKGPASKSPRTEAAANLEKNKATDRGLQQQQKVVSFKKRKPDRGPAKVEVPEQGGKEQRTRKGDCRPEGRAA